MPGPVSFDRKRQLITESGRLRGAISHELDGIESSLGWISQGAALGRQVQRGGLILTAVSGIFLAWKLFKGRTGEAAAAEETAGAGEESLFSKLAQGGFKLAAVAGPVLLKLLRDRAA